MSHRNSLRGVIAAILCFALLLSLVPGAAAAGTDDQYTADPTDLTGDISTPFAVDSVDEEMSAPVGYRLGEDEEALAPMGAASVNSQLPAELNADPGLTFAVRGGYAEVTGAANPTGIITIPASYDGYPVTRIGFNAFKDARTLQGVIMPDTIVTIDIQAFYNCIALSSVKFSAGLKQIFDNSFYNCTSLRTVELPDTLKTIGERAFQSTGISTLRIPKNLEKFGDFAFSGAPITKIQADGCLNYKVVDGVLYSKDGKTLALYPAGLEPTSFTVPSGVTEIGSSAFCGIETLKSVTLPKGLKVIGNHAFDYCTALTGITIPSGVTRINDGAFQDTAITTLTIPDSVKDLGSSFAANCTKLTTITFGSGVEYVPDWACYGCSALSKVNFSGSNIFVIWHGAFENCSSLRTISIPEGVHIIHNNAFCSTGLESVSLPSTLEYITYKSFCGAKLKAVTFPDGLKYVGRQSFAGNTRLSGVTLPNSVSFVYGNAFDSTGVDTGKVTADMILDISGNYYRTEQIQLAGTHSYDDAQKVLTLVNQERAKTGAAALKMDAELTEIAMQRAAEIAVYFNHDRPIGSSATNITSVYGENIAYGYADPKAAVAGWMRSQGHKENILRNWNSVGNGTGIGCYELDGIMYWVQVFGSYTSPATKTGTVKGTTTVLLHTDAQEEDTSYSPAERDEWYRGKGYHTPYFTFAVTPAAGKVQAGSTLSVQFQLRGSDSSNGEVILSHYSDSVQWASSNKAVAVGSGDVITGKQGGTAKLTANLGVLSASVDVTVEGKPVPDHNCPSYNYSDVPAGAWYHESVDRILESGLMVGTSSTTFAPNDKMTRAMVAAIIWRMAGSPAANTASFVDVPANAWYSQAAAWAAQQGVVSGVGGNRFDPNGSATREQVVAMLYRYWGSPTVQGNQMSSFTDAGNVSSWAQSAVNWAVSVGILKGSGNALKPRNVMTRAEAAAIFVRVFDLM